MGQNPFGGCSSLSIIKVDKNNEVFDSRNNCNAIIETGTNKLITGCKNTIIPNTVTTICIRAFMGCKNLTYINIPSSVITLEQQAFSNCINLESINLSENLTNI